MSRRRMLATWTFIPAFAGTICLMVAMRSPRFVDFHSMDVLQLLVPGLRLPGSCGWSARRPKVELGESARAGNQERAVSLGFRDILSSL